MSMIPKLNQSALIMGIQERWLPPTIAVPAAGDSIVCDRNCNRIAIATLLHRKPYKTIMCPRQISSAESLLFRPQLCLETSSTDFPFFCDVVAEAGSLLDALKHRSPSSTCLKGGASNFGAHSPKCSAKKETKCREQAETPTPSQPERPRA
jgi:hypothetical protein